MTAFIGAKRSWRRFTAEEDEVLRADWLAVVPIEETALKLNRSVGALRQRIFHHHKDLLCLPARSKGFGARLVKKYGQQSLESGASPREVWERLEQIKKQARLAAKKENERVKKLRADETLLIMLERISSGRDRNQCIFVARSAGVTLQRIADVLGITKERVRKICDRHVYNLSIKEQIPDDTKQVLA